MAKPKEDRMLTTAETAEILGVSPASVRVWLSEEGHPRFPNARRFGHVWQIPESDLAELPRGRKRGRPKKEGVKMSSKKTKQGALFFAGRVTSNGVIDATDDATEKKKPAAKKKGARAK
jgi:Helix-turn-helix domain